MRRYLGLIILGTMLAAAGCNDFGHVDQGRVITYDKGEKTFVMIRDISPDPKKPDYTGLPPVTYTLPADPDETGPAPAAGHLMKIDLDKKEAVVFVSPTKSLATIPYTVIEQKKVDPKSPLVYDETTKKLREFPIIDQQRKTIELYLEKKKTLLTFSVPDEYFLLPRDTWRMGDEVRVYYKKPGQSLRFMNITKTDIFKK